MQVNKNSFQKGNKVNRIVNVIKIAVIIFVSIYLIGNFIPFFEGENSYLYGLTAIHFSEGKFSISNELLKESGREEFVSGNWLKTNENEAIPRSGYGFSAIASVFYSIGGYYGLFYAAPIIAIILLVVTERTATNLFGKHVGLLALLFLATDHLFFRNTIRLQTEGIFAVFFILGAFWLIKFFRTYDERSLLYATIVLVGSTFVRINGVILFPVEILLIVSFFVIQHLRKYRIEQFDQNKKKKILRISAAVLIPWIIFFVFWFSFYDHFFGDPWTNYRLANPERYNPDSHRDAKVESLIIVETKDFENAKQFSKYLLPYQFPAVYNKVSNNLDEELGENWLGIIPMSILLCSLFFALKTKQYRIEILVFLAFIAGTIWFFSSVTTEERASFGVPARYMIPCFILSFMIYGHMIMKIFNSKKIAKFSFVPKIWKISIVCILSVFFIGAFYFTPPIESIKTGTFEIKNPQIFADRYPLDLDGISTDSIILARHLDWVIDYGAIPFKLPFEMEQKSVDLLKQSINDGYDAFVFKEETYGREKEALNNLVANHGFVLKEYSDTFCKIEITNEKNGLAESDKICL